MSKTLKPIRPNAGVRAAYTRELVKLLREMNRDILAAVDQTYSRQEKRLMAADAAPRAPVTVLSQVIEKAMEKWRRRWDKAARKLARHFVESIDTHALKAMQRELKRAGFTIKMDDSIKTDATIQALIVANVHLIQSIPDQYETDLYGIVMRGVTDGAGATEIRDEIQKRYKVSERRAQFIARDQTNKAFESIKRTRDEALGITRGIWIHVPGLKTSRASHKKMNGQEFIISEGCYDSAVKRKVHCGELPGCQCTYRVIVPEFGDKE